MHRTKEPMRVVVIAESVEDRRALAESFPKSGWKTAVQAFGDEHSAWAYMRDQSQRNSMPNLIVLDPLFAGKRGLEMLRDLKADPILRRLPVILLGAKLREEEIEHAYSLHASCCLERPSTSEALDTLVREIVRFWSLVEFPVPS